MNRFLTVVAATVVAAAITVPALAGDSPPATKDAQFVACLRAHGLAIPADTSGDAVKGWLLAHPGNEAAVDACQPRGGGKDLKLDQLTACLRGQGLTPPADPVALKQWIGQHEGDAALKACGVDTPRDDKVPGACGTPQPAAAGAAAKRE